MIVALKAYEIKTFCLYTIIYQNFIFLYRGLEIAIFVSGDLEYTIFMYVRRLENVVFLHVMVLKSPFLVFGRLENATFWYVGSQKCVFSYEFFFEMSFLVGGERVKEILWGSNFDIFYLDYSYCHFCM